jgi:chromosome segregation ATPase
MPELTPEELALIEAGASVDDTDDEVDEILTELQSQKTVSETRYNELSERLNQCLTRLEALSAGSNAENPILTQLSNQIAEIRVDVTAALNSLEDMKAKNLAQSESQPIVVEEIPSSLSLDESTEEPSEENVAPTPVRKNRML